MGIFNRKKNKGRDEPKVRSVEKPGRYMRSVVRVNGDRTLIGNEAIYAAVSRIANTMAMMPMHLYKGHELQREHPLEKLMQRPNSNHTAFTFKQTLETIRDTEGNAYALIVPDKLGTPMRLDVLDPTKVQPRYDPETKELWYMVQLDDNRQYPLPACQMIVLKHMSANGSVGVRPIDVLRGTLEYDQQTKAFSLSQLDGVNQGIFLTVPNTGLGREQKDLVIDNFLDAYERSGQRVVVLEGGLTAQTFSQSPIDAQILDVERIMRNRVATVYNIPPHLLGDYSDTSFGTAEQQMQEYLNLTIMPIVAQWEEEFNRKLLTEAEVEDGYAFRFEVSALLRADTSARAAYYHNAIRDSYMKVNEVRAAEGLPPDEFGNCLMASRDLIPLRIGVATPEILLGGAAAPAKGEDEQ